MEEFAEELSRFALRPEWPVRFPHYSLTPVPDTHPRNPREQIESAQQGFLDAVYSDLKNVHGLILFRADEFHAVTGADNHVDIVPCHTGSGVAAGGGESRPPVLPCTGMFISGFSDFLNISVKCSNKFRIQRFYAAGNFLDGRSGVTRQDCREPPGMDPARNDRGRHPR